MIIQPKYQQANSWGEDYILLSLKKNRQQKKEFLLQE